MTKKNDAFISESDTEDGAVGLEGPKGGLLGEMPRKSRFGYIFAGNILNTETLLHTIAHELGHGIFTLQHTFDSEYGKGTQKTTKNLLDYDGGKELAAFQWNVMASPAIFTGADKASDGEFAGRYALTPNFKFIHIDNSSVIYISNANKVPTGTLPGFIVNYGNSTEQHYIWDNNLRSYVREDTQSPHPTAKIVDKIAANKEFYVFYNVEKGCHGGAYITLKYPESVGYLTQAKILELIMKFDATNRSLPIACLDSSSSNNTAWKGIPLDCSAQNIKDLLADGGKDIKPATIRMREHKMDFTLPDIPQFTYNPESGSLKTIDADGNPQTIKIDVPENASYESIFPMLVTDNKGNIYQVSPAEQDAGKGKGTDIDVENGNKGEKIALNCERVDRVGDFNTESLSRKYGYVHFERGEGKYAFDAGKEKWYKKSVKVDRFYKPFAKGDIAPWKLVPSGETDVVTARHDGRKEIDLKKVRFVSEPNSAALPAKLNETEMTWKSKIPKSKMG